MIRWRAEINTLVFVFASTSTFQLCRFWLACLLIWTLCWQIVFNLGCKTCYRAKKKKNRSSLFLFFFFALKRVSFFRVVKGWRFHRLFSFGSVLYQTILAVLLSRGVWNSKAYIIVHQQTSLVSGFNRAYQPRTLERVDFSFFSILAGRHW